MNNNCNNYKIDKLKVGSLNVCGLKRRSNYSEFIKMVNRYDIFLVNETKLDIYDQICLNGYTFVNVPRKQKVERKSGGLGAFIKNEFFRYIEVIHTQCDYLFWLKLSSKCTGLTHDIILGTVYVPPIQSRFYKNDEFEIFENEITDMCNKYECVYIIGDYNAQISELPEFTVSDDFLWIFLK